MSTNKYFKLIPVFEGKPLIKFDEAVRATQEQTKRPYCKLARITNNDFWVLDFDINHSTDDNSNGIANWQEVFAGTLLDIETLKTDHYHVTTKSGGVHIYFAMPENYPNFKASNTTITGISSVDVRQHPNSLAFVYDDLDIIPNLSPMNDEAYSLFEANREIKDNSNYDDDTDKLTIHHLEDDLQESFVGGLLNGAQSSVHTWLLDQDSKFLKQLGYTSNKVKFGFSRKFIPMRTDMYLFVKCLREFELDESIIERAMNIAVDNTKEHYIQRYVSDALASRHRVEPELTLDVNDLLKRGRLNEKTNSD